MFKSKKAILVTGGIDSTTLMYMYENPILITIDYGQKVFPIQVKMIRYHIKKLNLSDLIIISIEYKDWQKKQGLFKENYIPNEKNPLENWNNLRYADFFIEGRNMIMIAYALAYCSSYKIDELLAGYLYSENEWENRRSYKLITGDNSPQFVDMMNVLSQVGLSYQVRFKAPFYEYKWSKQDVVNYGIKNGIDYSKTYSCYFTPPCNKCDNCLLRKKILK
jgi:7-cyano-7-deazaguanine synthase